MNRAIASVRPSTASIVSDAPRRPRSLETGIPGTAIYPAEGAVNQRVVRMMGSVGVDFNVAMQAFLHWLSINFGIGGGVGIS
ncbi:hypothetical protein BTZ20_4560 [Rhodococcus sp. MTM3W5.2]|nr:hypothetical protein BTZ20_4560 [Rhodococcus sp. MTM3W5.2]